MRNPKSSKGPFCRTDHRSALQESKSKAALIAIEQKKSKADLAAAHAAKKKEEKEAARIAREKDKLRRARRGPKPQMPIGEATEAEDSHDADAALLCAPTPRALFGFVLSIGS